ncbi:hypothetical protein [Maricaulis sp.]|uniref:hypothetical protein n=1 Tax=Maricaulis sp. TaxID=1486257 RepID=UPI0026207A4A|nr:hypothetical protein [Maricaulis sp.]
MLGQSFSLARLVQLAGWLIIARALWALLNHTVITLYRFDIANPAGIGGTLGEMIMGLPLILLVPVFLFPLGYLAAGYLAVRGRTLAALIYGIAFLVDAGLWVFMSTVEEYRLILDGQASALDAVFNLFDLCMLGFLMFWALMYRSKV